MILDALVNFWPIGNPLSLANLAAGAAVPSNVVDLIGAGPGTPPANIIGNRTTFGTDMGIGTKKPLVDIATLVNFTTGSGATLNVAFQGAPDTGSGGGYQPGTWQTFMETGEMTAAQLVANTVFGRFDFPPAFPANDIPRYLRLLFQISAGDTFTAGAIAYAVVTMDRDDQANKFAAANYSVA